MANLARWCVILAALVGAPAAPAQASDSAPEGPPVESQPPQSPQEAPMQPPPVQQRMAPAPYGAPCRGDGFRAACGFDAERLCAGVPPGGGRIIECLMSYRPRALSPPCRSFIAGGIGAGPGYGRGPGYGPGPSYDPGPAYGPGPGYGRDLGPGAGYGPGAGRNQNGGYPPPYGALPPGPPGSVGTPPPGGQPGNASSRARSTQKTAPSSSTTPSPPEAAPDSSAQRRHRRLHWLRLRPTNERTMPHDCARLRQRRRREIMDGVWCAANQAWPSAYSSRSFVCRGTQRRKACTAAK
jgi:hypothetical protein